MSNNSIDPVVADVLRFIHSIDNTAHLVGGAIRDYFLGKPRSVDLDIAIEGDGFEICKHLAENDVTDVAFVPLDKQTGTGRLVFSSPVSAILDVSSFKGENIREDLTRRDFTINSMAVGLLDFLTTGFANVIDPCGGRDDLANGKIRACSEYVFTDDPLRILRVFRFSSTLGFTVVPETLRLIAPSVSLLAHVAPERIRDELFAMLSVCHSVGALGELDRLGILDILLPEIAPIKGCVQNDYHHLDVWNHSIETVRQLEGIMESLPQVLEAFGEKIQAYLADQPVKGRPRAALLKLTALLHDAGKPGTKTIDSNGKIRFFGHERISKLLFDDLGTRLKLANKETETVGKWIAGHMRPSVFSAPPVSRRAVHRVIRDFEEDIIGLSLLFIADICASQGPLRKPSDFHEALAGVSIALSEYYGSLGTRKVPLLNGKDLMALLGLTEGPELGRIIRELRELQDLGDITSPTEALSAATKLLIAYKQDAQFACAEPSSIDRYGSLD